MGCGASTAAAPPGGGSAPTGKPGKAPDNGLPKGIVPDKSGKGKYDMKALFAQFDADGDGKLDIYEIARAFRAIGLTKRSGEKSDMDKAMFKSFDVNGDGYVTMDELDATLPKALRDKIDTKIDLGWFFDKALWEKSISRHQKHDMKKIFADFDADGDGKLDIYELARAFRALGLPKRDGSKMDMDKSMFKSFDTNGDGFVSMAELDANLKPKTRRKIVDKLEAGWKFDKKTWDESVARHKKYDMKKIFADFDADGDGKLDIYEIARAFRSMGLPKRDGKQMDMDHAMFKAFDTNGDGFVSMEELDANLKPKTRRKIEMKLEAGWKFDKATWDASCARHNKWNMAEVFKNFDQEGTGKLDIYTLARAFRALQLPKRDGKDKMDMDKAMFKSFDTNGDGYVTLEEFQANLKPKTRKKIEQKLEAGWTFDKEAWDASVARHKKWDMKVIFGQFDTDGDAKLDIYEIARAFRAMGLPKRDGSKMDMDHAMFKAFDTNGDGFVSMEELDANLKPKTRRKIEMKLEAGWKFDKATWDASCARHNKWNMAEVFKNFDQEGTGKLDIYTLARAFRALQLPKRDGKDKMDMDKAMFKSFDTNGDGYVTLEEFQANLKPKTRKKIEQKLEAGWTFDKEAWDASVARHKKWDMKVIFGQFDTDGDAKLDIYEIARAFRAMGLPKRDGSKMDMDHAMFKAFDTNGDGFVSMEELDANLKPKTRKKIEMALEGGWKFDQATWDASIARHKKYDMKVIFAQFDHEGKGRLDIYTIARAFRAMGLPKRDGAKMEMDKAMFKAFDTNGDGYISMEELDANIKPKTRRKIELLLEGGWTFDKAAWDVSIARHKKWNMADVFKNFDYDGDGKLTIKEFYRAFRALGLEKRAGEKMEIDKAMFDSFDTNGDGFVTLVEFQEGLLPKTRKKIVDKLEGGWTFDKTKWDESVERHKDDA